MGKGNRTKNEKAASVLASSAKKKNVKKGQMPTWVGTLILVAVLAVIIVFSVVSVLAQRGVFLRNKLIAETEHFEITVPMMSYMVYTEYQSFVNQYQESGWMAYIKGNGGTGLNTSLPLREQMYSQPTAEKPDTSTMTWFDYFASSATNSVVQVLTLCEQAYALGITLDDEDMQSIESTMQMLEIYALYSGYELNAYIPMMYGNGVRDKDVRAMLELTTLATKMTNLKMDELRGGATDVRVNLYYDENKDDLDVYADYISYTFTAKFDAKDGDTEAIQNENTTAWEKYNADRERYSAIVDELKACTTAEEFCNKLEEFLAKSKDEGGEGMTDTEAFLAQSGAHHFDYKKDGGADDEIEKFLFNTENPPAANSTTVIKDTQDGRDTEDYKDENGEEQKRYKYSDATSTYTAVFVLKPVHRDEAKMQNVGHILFKTDTYKDLKDTSTLSGKAKELAQRLLDKGKTISAKEMADELIVLMTEEGAITQMTAADGKTTYQVIDKDKFEAYAKDYNEDSNVFYDDVARGDMVAEFEEWLYNPNRQQNEISNGGIETTYGHHVMFYNGASEKINWIEEAREQIASNDYEAWYKAASEGTVIETQRFQKNWKKVG